MRFALVLLFLVASGASSQPLSPLVDSIPMRDGKKLAADIYIPSGCIQCPVILIQTPYNRLYYRWGLPLGTGTALNSSNYVFVILDWRGFYGSASALTANPKRGEDGYDAVEWITQQAWSNGKVGTWGPSALGKVQFQTAKENPPGLLCAVPLVAGPQFNYDEYFEGGVYRTEFVEQLDALGYGLSGFLLANPVYNLTWQYVENLNFYPADIKVPVLMIGGWYDHNIKVMLDFFKAIRYSSSASVKDKHRLLMGPWAHGGFGAAQVGSGQQGSLVYPNAAGWSDSLALRFFDFYLRNQNNNWQNEPNVRYYQLGENSWKNDTAWIPSATEFDFYFHPDGTLENFAPAGGNDSAVIIYDPRDPSPTIGGPTLSPDLLQGPYRQDTAVENRNDVLVFTSGELTQNVVLKGKPGVHLKISSDRLDTDFAVRLTDVYPDGKSMFISDGIFRMRFRNGFTAADTSVMLPGTIYDVSIALPDVAYTFLAGHRIRADITSSNYPRFDSNLNNGQQMYAAGDTLIATNTVYLNSQNFSYIRMPLINYIAEIEENNPGMEECIVYPNPGNGIFTLEVPYSLPDGLMIITNALGEILIKAPVFHTQTRIDLSGFPSGIYFCRMFFEDKVLRPSVLVKE